jgi:hypothetical protein
VVISGSGPVVPPVSLLISEVSDLVDISFSFYLPRYFFVGFMSIEFLEQMLKQFVLGQLELVEFLGALLDDVRLVFCGVADEQLAFEVVDEVVVHGEPS